MKKRNLDQRAACTQEECHVKTDVRLPQLRNDQKLRERPGTKPSLVPSEGLVDTLVLYLWSLELRDNTFVDLSHPVCGTLLGQPEQMNS